MSIEPNIGPKQRKARQLVGILGVVAVVGGAVAAIVLPISPLWAGLLLVPGYVATLGLQQASTGT